jgi:hypothetical protein
MAVLGEVVATSACGRPPNSRGRCPHCSSWAMARRSTASRSVSINSPWGLPTRGRAMGDLRPRRGDRPV